MYEWPTEPKNLELFWLRLLGRWWRCLRLRVKIDITKPLEVGAKGNLGDGKESWFSFQYENLPIFCYKCGVLGHLKKACKDTTDTSKQMESLTTKIKEQCLDESKALTGYGPWLRDGVGEEDDRFLNIEKKKKEQGRAKSEIHNQKEESTNEGRTARKPGEVSDETSLDGMVE
uniref:CCHC-type domain-containing protein n=1 Tax=Nelumbo nucifera TaxID=4432 RepID=A0A822XGC9_NELNU|nr:TPA_asm: hypothetical protein HUJ06_022007 [Nelumbo nucifera]